MPTLICDLDGVVWLARQAIPGAPQAISRFRANGWRVLFVTNNSFAPSSDVEAWLAHIGIPAAGDVRTSAMAAARLLARGERIVVLAGPGVREAVAAAGATVVGIPGRIVEETPAQKTPHFAAYAVEQGQDDPYAQQLQRLAEHSADLERALAKLKKKLADLEKEDRKEQLRAIK